LVGATLKKPSQKRVSATVLPVRITASNIGLYPRRSRFKLAVTKPPLLPAAAPLVALT
jgi:hypothetical protein